MLYPLTPQNPIFKFGQSLLLMVALLCMDAGGRFADAFSLPVLRVPEIRLNQPGEQPGVYGMIVKPGGSQPAPAVVILHGRSGIFPDYRQLAHRLAKQGYVALVLDYYAESGGVPPRNEPRRKELWPTFERTVQQSVRYLSQRADVDADRIGLLGLSQGAMLAISTAGITPSVKAVVTYYPRRPWSFDEILDDLPPLLILHGENDPWHKAADAQQMHDDLTQRGKSSAITIYPKASHGFNVLSRFYQPEATADAERRALNFLAQHLQPESSGTVSTTEGFEATVTHFYAVDLPNRMSVPGGSIEGLFNLAVFAREQYTYTNQYHRGPSGHHLWSWCYRGSTRARLQRW